jgi:hypothetical protein
MISASAEVFVNARSISPNKRRIAAENEKIYNGFQIMQSCLPQFFPLLFSLIVLHLFHRAGIGTQSTERQIGRVGQIVLWRAG